MTDHRFHLEIESDPRNLITIEEFVNYFAFELQVPEDKMPGLLLALTEASTNAIMHGNKSNPEKIVSIDAFREDNKLIVTVKDQGVGFDDTKIPDPTAPENLLKDSGRGLYLMKIYMDELKYNYTPTGTETILVMNL